ncbi:MAG: recombination mediator RecR [Phycisphaerae bacterium]|nr:MAG: recombination protein RecR [Planctomycetota bacterium]KAB2947175.1 MAG: recombination protein RecR [Phycisphaerae bacterium]MBE7458833.1 recombination protein RecR [Planctomycetia bacterium]MCK6465843.1 recombination mediator RecR [Phycisphaerae bacterium]MCL4719633.1 recombination mediator RecR [Phycisphaerae bacterium]
MSGRGHIESLERLKELLKRLPGIGARSAERIAFHILRSSREDAEALASGILDVKTRVLHCSRCFNLTETDPCAICADPRRDASEIWVVEQPHDVLALESTGLVRGVYHVLLGHISAMDRIEPGDLTLEALVRRVKDGGVREVVLALNPTLEGDGTALYIQSLLSSSPVTLSRPARGLAVGSQIEYATGGMLEAAIKGRTRC